MCEFSYEILQTCAAFTESDFIVTNANSCVNFNSHFRFCVELTIPCVIMLCSHQNASERDKPCEFHTFSLVLYHWILLQHKTQKPLSILIILEQQKVHAKRPTPKSVKFQFKKKSVTHWWWRRSKIKCIQKICWISKLHWRTLLKIPEFLVPVPFSQLIGQNSSYEILNFPQFPQVYNMLNFQNFQEELWWEWLSYSCIMFPQASKLAWTLSTVRTNPHAAFVFTKNSFENACLSFPRQKFRNSGWTCWKPKLSWRTLLKIPCSWFSSPSSQRQHLFSRRILLKMPVCLFFVLPQTWITLLKIKTFVKNTPENSLFLNFLPSTFHRHQVYESHSDV